VSFTNSAAIPSYEIMVLDRCVVLALSTSRHICKYILFVCRVKNLAFSSSRLTPVAAFAPTSSNIVNNTSGSVDNGVIVNTIADDIDTSDIIPDIKEAIDNTIQLIIRKINQFRLCDNPSLEEKHRLLKMSKTSSVTR
jgi:hypothetical protein